MTVSVVELKKTFDRLLNRMTEQRRKCDAVDSWIRPELDAGFKLPAKASWEHRALQKLSRTPWLKLVVDNVAQAMYVDNIITTDGASVPDLWGLWLGSGMQAKQIALHRAMVAYGQAFIIPTRLPGTQRPVLRILSPRHAAVEYRGLAGLDYPSAALELITDHTDGRRSYVLYLPGSTVRVDTPAVRDSGAVLEGIRFSDPIPSTVAQVPVIRFANQLDVDGRVLDEVTPFIPAAQRINKTAYDRLLAQHFSSWKVRTISGIDLPAEVDDDGEPTGGVDKSAADRMKMKLAQDDILIAESPDVKFGTLDGTGLDQFVNSWRADIEALAAVSQTPAHSLTGQIVNLSAEALAAARAPLMQRIYERQMNAGAAYSSTLKMAARLWGRMDLADDDMITVSWQDMEIRSLSQSADALGKMASMLKIPAQGLWSLIPGVTQTDIMRWTSMAEDEAANDPLNLMVNRHTADQPTGDEVM